MNILRKLNQTAVRWAKGALKGDGNTEYSSGVEIAVRWDDKRDLFKNRLGESQMSRAIVYTIGTQAMSIDDKLHLGTVASLPAGGQADPNIVSTAFNVEAVGDTPSLRNTQSLKTVTL